MSSLEMPVYTTDEFEIQAPTAGWLQPQRLLMAFGRVLKYFFDASSPELRQSIQTLEKESREVLDEVQETLVSIQYQDRTNQILAHVL